MARKLLLSGIGCGLVTAGLTRREPLHVYYKGEAYDVSGFVDMHPGGKDLLLGAVGKDLETFFRYYTIHNNNPRVDAYLEGLKDDRVSGRQVTQRDDVVCSNQNWFKRYINVLCVVLTLPLWLLLRTVFRSSSALCSLPVAVGHTEDEGAKQIAIIGGGIAGCGAAYALKKAGHEVTIYESREKLGGNATTFTWSLGNNKYVNTGLAVLAWPVKYFKNYTTLLGELSIDTVDVELPFFIRSRVPGCEGDFAQADTVPASESLHIRFEDDFKKWDKAVEFVRSMNQFFCRSEEPSLYHSSYFNPLNLVSLKRLLACYGCSQEFWDVIVVSQYGSSFLTNKIEGVLCPVLPILDDMIPLNRVPGHEGAVMQSWKHTSEAVFDKMTHGCKVHCSSRVLSVTPYDENSAHKQEVVTQEGKVSSYDNVVFACNASAVANILKGSSWVENALLRGVSYTDDSDVAWMTGHMHQDTSLLPERYATRLANNYANYIHVTGEHEKSYEQHFIIGSWYATNQVYGDEKQPLFVSHGISADRMPQADKLQGSITHARAHPDLNLPNLVISQLLHLVQGRRGVYYCSSYTTPGNGHDLSLLSGFIAASRLGAPYPFGDGPACEDFKRLRRLM
eukprot:TRINITY_DN18912_c0_g1_i1.p1 TRINITY_DN18912_c0_g1~~TRINITY_DN18912_c0_g1_i1.p1  ORF type:complete len:620 (+),score=108.38 TRINITY_DN18912_c0_g1_i1:38-1897(+)